MADDAVELAFEGCDKVIDKYHDYMFDHAHKVSSDLKARRGGRRGGAQGRPGMQRRSSSLPPDNQLQMVEEGRAGLRRRDVDRDRAYSRDRYAGRQRTYVDDYQEEYRITPRQQYYDDRGSERNDGYGRYGRDQSRDQSRNHSGGQARGQARDHDDDKVRRPRTASNARKSQQLSKSLNNEDSQPMIKGKTHHLAAAVAGGVAGGFVGHTGGRGDIKAAIAGALIGALGAGIADTALEKRQKREKKEDKDWENKFER